MPEGDPLTTQLPRTKVLVPEVLGPVRSRSASTKLDWPHVPDPEALAFEKLKPGAVVSVRTRFGVRTWLVRTIGRTKNGRRWISAMDRRGICHSAMVSQIISVDTLKRHLYRSVRPRALNSGSVE